ncbi:MAG: ParB/RepB/Spo0J family partition protein [Christensenellales bacterium]
MGIRSARAEANLSVVRNIPIEGIVSSPNQPRKHFVDQAMDELAASMEQVGLLQPITVRTTGNRKYELIAGERRLRAAERLGWTHIHALVVDATPTHAALMTVIENLQRENLHFFEEAQGYLVLINEHGMTQEQVARRVGKRQSTVANKLRLLRISAPLREMIIRSSLTERHVRSVLRLPDEASQAAILKRASDNGWTVRQCEQAVEQRLKEIAVPLPQVPGQKIKGLLRDSRIFVNAVIATVDEIRKAGIPVQITRKEDSDSIVLEIRFPRSG